MSTEPPAPHYPPPPVAYVAPAKAPTNTMARATLILVIVGAPLLFCMGFGSIVFLASGLTGIVAIRDSAKYNGEGRALGWLGVCLGGASILFLLLIILYAIQAIIVAVSPR